uniref:GTPase IMAP family member 7-like isoform X2 n=1 Tax=Crassostrea virginica TaxID=6565 RepID=A0A8B8A773_CRAVI|nr:GTPase IMAP family member 7-like isoform X2 [Crassostrea virginica]
MAASSELDYDNKVQIVLIGKTQVGKSTIGNIILGFHAFDTKLSAASVTSKTECKENDRFGKQLVVVDTPGFFHTELTEEELRNEYCKWSEHISPGIQAIVLVIQAERFTEEDEKTFKFFKTLFGDNLKDYLIVVFTHICRLEDQHMSIDQFVETIDKSSNLQKLICKSNKRYIALGNTASEEEVQNLLGMIEEIKEVNGGKYYSNELFKRAQEVNSNSIGSRISGICTGILNWGSKKLSN